MKKIALTIAAIALSTSAFASISDGNSDLQGWAVDNAPQAGSLHRGDNDSYGSVTLDKDSGSASPAEAGVGDSYGSILHSVGFDF